MNFAIGVMWATVLSLPLWAAILWLWRLWV